MSICCPDQAAYCYDPPGIRESRCGTPGPHCDDAERDWYNIGACIATLGIPYSCRRCVSNSRVGRAMGGSGGGVRWEADGGWWGVGRVVHA